MSQHFEHDNMAGTTFTSVNLGETTFEDVSLHRATFRNVNLGEATFTNVNLAGATIRDADLEGMSIGDANIAGLTIFGFRIDALIRAELDRRDPERVRLRIGDLNDPASVREVIARLEQLRASFRSQLRATPAAVLAARPNPDEWSALEIVRHLLFAEDLYLNRFILQNDRPLNPSGVLSDYFRDRPGFDQVGSVPGDDLETILAAWDQLHAEMRALVDQLTPERL
ncbi:MAG: DinB family protein, partial [Chloroflexi bacterium]|nr:DinB family protein [Chloroflexota bacterium]